MNLTGFADEAGRDLATQIRTAQELGWNAISARAIDGVNLHELPEERFVEVADTLDAAGVQVPEFGSIIANWGKKITSDFDLTLAEIDRAIPRMQRLRTPLIRIMSYAQEPWGQDQQEEERFRRLRIIVQKFADAGLTAAHENCMNWGGFSASHTLRLLEEIPGLKLIFDTGNPVFQRDRSKPEPQPWQDPWEFWKQVRDHVVHIHVKDCINPPMDGVEPIYTMPGEGQARIQDILADAKIRGYDGWIAIEPHLGTVFHIKDQSQVDWQQCYDSYVEYGRRMEALIAGLPG